jgi:hypothetical protein
LEKIKHITNLVSKNTLLTEIYKKRVILEKAQNASYIRKIVRDVITLYKKELEGEFYLPDELDNSKTEYTLPNSQIEVELIIQPSDEVNDFMVNANFYRDDDIIVVKIVYNPNKKTQIIYELIGELNEVISHELRHQFQRDTGMFEFNDEEDDDGLEGLEYYSQPHEIDAQVEGFKRMRDVTRRPFEELVRNWFRTHQDIHYMNPEDTKKVIDLILNRYRNS